MNAPNPPLSILVEAAVSAIKILKANGLNGCVIGGLACKGYGNSRDTADVDVLVLRDITSTGESDLKRRQEQLKEMLVKDDSTHFYLVASKRKGATHRILHFRHSGQDTKVDVVLPGIMEIPSLPPAECYTATILEKKFEVVPYKMLLYMKLRGWEDRTNWSPQKDKMKTDEQDIRFLLSLEQKYTDKETLPSEFLRMGERRLARFKALSDASSTML